MLRCGPTGSGSGPGHGTKHAGRENDPRLFDRIQKTADGSPERAALLREIVGPDVRVHFGHDAFDDP